MSEDPVRKYLDAKRELDTVYAQIQRLQQVVGEVHSGLHRPFTFVVTNAGVNFPREAESAKLAALDANDWPSAREIAEVMAALYQTYKNVETYWKAIPEADRRNITPPPGRR